jgi:carbon-monoxide dehydrogenase small subunit
VATEITFTVNNRKVSLQTDPLRRLLDVLREDFGLKGVKEGCGEGVCGSCSVLLNGRIVNSCLVPVGGIEGSEITTIEGYRETERYKVVSEIFADEGAVQCGYCTPGIMMTVESLFRNNGDPTRLRIKEALSGHVCRCTGYSMIIKAIERALEKVKADAEDVPA